MWSIARRVFDRDRAGLALLTLLTGGLTLIGWWLLCSQFMVYDDEGYVLWSLRQYAENGGLYDHVFSQYGPFYYVLLDGIHALTGLPFDLETGRMLALVCWLGCAWLAGIWAWRHTRSVLAGAVALMLTFAALTQMANEPGHPGSPLALMTAMVAIGGAWCLVQEKRRTFGLLALVIGTAMTLIKINVGGLVLVASGCWMLGHSRWRGLERIAPFAVAALAVGVPVLLMRAHWPAPWVIAYAVIFIAGALPLVLAIHRARTVATDLRTLGPGVAGAIVLLLAVVGVVLSNGTTVHGLVEGLLLAPLRHPHVYFLPPNWRPAAIIIAVFLAASAAIAGRCNRSTTMLTLIAVARLAVLGGMAAGALSQASADGEWLAQWLFSYAPALGWLLVVPLPTTSPVSSIQGRLWIAWVCLWQYLQGYPVAGSQVGWSVFLWIPLLVAGWHEAFIFLFSGVSAGRTWSRGIAQGAMVALALVTIWPRASDAWQRHSEGQPLGLPGARALRLRADLASDLRILDLNIRAHGGLLFSEPGLFSLNIITGHPTPTEANVTHWFSLLTDDRQQAIIRRLDADPTAVIVSNHVLLDALVRHGFTPDGPLHRYIAKEFSSAFRIDSYDFKVRRGRSITPYGTARILSSVSNPGRFRVELHPPALRTPAIALELRLLFPPRSLVQRIPISEKTPWIVTPDGSAPFQLLTPVPIPDGAKLTIDFEHTGPLPPAAVIELHLIDAAGGSLAALRFVE